MNEAKSSLVQEVKEKQENNPIIMELKENVHKHKVMNIEFGGYGMLRYQVVCFPKVDELQERIMKEAHSSTYSIY